MGSISKGDMVAVTTAEGKTLKRMAMTGPVDGDDFRVVWVCKVEDFGNGDFSARPRSAMAWPIEAVRIVGNTRTVY